MSHSVLPVASRALVDACARLGVRDADLLGGVGLTRAQLDDPDARLSAEAADAVWQEAYARTGDPLLALHAAEVTPFGAFRVLDYLAATGADLGEGLRRVAAYFPIIDARGALRVDESPDRVALVFRSTVGAPLPPPAQEYTLAVLLMRGRHITAGGWSPLEVRFAFPRPVDAREHARVFGVPPVFGADEAALVLSRAVWELPTRSADRGLFATLDEHAHRLLARLPDADQLTSRARATIAEVLPGGEPSLAVVARRMAMSRRSLQRRLEEAGTSFAQLVDAVRRERAEAYLRAADVSIAEVSWLVGFSEQSAFARAFKRWTGRAPTEFREQLVSVER